MADYYTLLTNAGIAYETACKAAGTPIKLAKMSVGDGNGSVYNPDATAVALRREVWRGDLNALFQDKANPSWLLAEVTIPPEVGGWYVREAGIWTDTGILYAIVKYPESYKPVLATSGSGKEFYIRSIIETSNSSIVTLLVDDNVVKATRAWVAEYVAGELNKLDGKKSARAATTGPVVLSGAQLVDGVAVVSGDRVLVKDQAYPQENGIYVVSNGAWTRSTDADTNLEVTSGLYLPIEEGAINADSVWQLVTDGQIALGTTALAFEMIGGRTGVSLGSYRSVTVDRYGRVVAGSNPTTLSGYGIEPASKAEAEASSSQDNTKPMTALRVWQAISKAVSQATETVFGWAKIATQSQTNSGVDDSTIVTPKKLRAGFSSSLTVNGYIALPYWLGGLILQWGRGFTGALVANEITYVPVSFVIPFPDSALSVNTVPGNTSPLAWVTMSSERVARGGYENAVSTGASNTGFTFFYWAIGC